MNIEGLGKKVVENFWDLNLVKLPQDIYKLNFEKISQLEGWGKLSAENLKKSINKTKNISLEKFIYSLGIRHIGQENAKILAKYFQSIKLLKNLYRKKNNLFKDLLELDGIGETQINFVKKLLFK